MRRGIGIFVVLVSGLVAMAAVEIPLVYDKEDMNANAGKPPLRAFADLPSITSLPDPFRKADGSRVTTKEEWRVRRSEIRAYLEHYDVGEKPGKPSVFRAKLNGDTINITVGEDDKTFEMTATIARPAGVPANKKIPAIIGIGAPTGSLPRQVFV